MKRSGMQAAASCRRCCRRDVKRRSGRQDLRLRQRKGQVLSQKDGQTLHILNFEDDGRDWAL